MLPAFLSSSATPMAFATGVPLSVTGFPVGRVIVAVVFAGTSTRPLAQKIAESLAVKVRINYAKL